MKSRSEFAKKDKNHESFGRNDRDTASSSAAGVPLLTLEVGTSRFRFRNLRPSSSARKSLSSQISPQLVSSTCIFMSIVSKAYHRVFIAIGQNTRSWRKSRKGTSVW